MASEPGTVNAPINVDLLSEENHTRMMPQTPHVDEVSFLLNHGVAVGDGSLTWALAHMVQYYISDRLDIVIILPAEAAVLPHADFEMGRAEQQRWYAE